MCKMGKFRLKSLCVTFLLLFLSILSSRSIVVDAAPPTHRSNHAVIVSSSRYWFNYRHVVNALSIYQLCKSHGIPDENIVLMLADELPANPRNPSRNIMTADNGRTNLYSDDIEIDYRGDEVTVDNLVRVLLGRHGDDGINNVTTSTRALHSDEDSHVLIYWTGHGGDSFFKFQDVEEITSSQIARVFQQMYDAKRYKEVLFIADTCQAFTLGDDLGSSVPNVYMVGSSLRNENSYAHHSDSTLGLSVIERYTHALVQFLEKKDLKRQSLKQGLVDHLRFQEQRAHVGYRDDGCERKFHTVPMSDFLANVPSSGRLTPLYKDDLSKLPSLDTYRVSSGSASPSTGRVSKKDGPAMDTEIDTCRDDRENEASFQGMEPSDPRFVLALLLFVGFVWLASHFVGST